MDLDINVAGESAGLTNDIPMHRIDSHSQDLPISERIKVKLRNIFTVKTLKKRLPFLSWLPDYNCDCLVGDAVAGLTVGLMIIPQALAYGLVAGLSPNYGLYSAFVGCIVYFFLGSTRELSIGPTAIMSLMTFHYSSQGGADYAVLLCFVTGVIEVLAGVVNLGFLINFISQPVISGFTSAAALTIASSQLKSLFGLKLSTKGVIDTWYQVCTNIEDARWQDLTLGLSCIALLTLMKEMRSWNCKCLNSPTEQSTYCFKKIVFFLSVGRNALIVLIAALIAFSLDGEDQPFTLTGDVTPGIPIPRLPPFSTTVNNVTMNFFDIVSDIGIGIVMVPFIAILDDIAVVSATAKGRPFDATQEIIALGVISVVGAFFSSLPTTASLSRTAINITSGVRTPTGGLVTGAIVLLALAFLTPFFKFIPKSTLAAVIICAVLHMFDYEIVRPLWRTRKADSVPLFLTFLACLFIGLEWGILLGIAVNLFMMLVSIATPVVHVVYDTLPSTNSSYILVTPTTGIFYPSTLHIKTAILKAGMRQGRGTYPVVVNCVFIISMDYTSSKGLKDVIEDFDKRKQPLIFIKAQPQVRKAMKAITSPVFSESLEDVDKTLEIKKRTTHEDYSAIMPNS